MPNYEIEFYADEDGYEPARTFFYSLDRQKRAAIGVAMFHYLQTLGPNVVETELGKHLGDGLYEFRLNKTAEQILRKVGEVADPEPSAKILLRVFFHAYGDRIILLLSGYDKGEHGSATYQNAEIERARKHLRDWRRRNGRGSRA